MLKIWVFSFLLGMMFVSVSAVEEPKCQHWVRGFSAPFKVSFEKRTSLNRLLAPIFETLTANLPGVRWANQRALRLHERSPDQSVFSKALELAEIDYELYAPYLDAIPKKGPVIFLSNHRGMDDAMIDGDWAIRIRPDLKFVIGLNAAVLPDLHPHAFVVDNSERSSVNATNIRFLKNVIQHLNADDGGALFWYPSDYVDQWNRWRGEVVPHPFFQGLAFVLRNSNATVVPVYHDSLNDPVFYQMSYLLRRFSPLLSAGLLPWALSRKQGMTLKTYVGKPISPEEWKSAVSTSSRRDLADFFQSQVERVPQEIKANHSISPVRPKKTSSDVFLGQDYRPERARLEIESLGDDRFLVGQRNQPSTRFLVLRFFAEEAPTLARGVGIGRELAFRDVGEGTGLDVDLDELDLKLNEPRFEQMAVVDTDTFRVVAGYRFKKGITYTRQFYERLPSELLAAPTLELSRAWVQPELQDGMMISTLWKGIGKILSLNLELDQLVGLVSMSSKDYPEEIRQLTHYFLLNGPYRLETREEAIAFSPPQFSALSEGEMKEILKDVKNIEDFERMIRQWPSRKVDLSQPGIINDHEPYGYSEGKSLPPLISGYLKMGAKVFGASIDPGFQGSLDFGILIPLKDIPPAYLKRFMGIEAYEKKRAHQESNLEPSD